LPLSSSSGLIHDDGEGIRNEIGAGKQQGSPRDDDKSDEVEVLDGRVLLLMATLCSVGQSVQNCLSHATRHASIPLQVGLHEFQLNSTSTGSCIDNE
jgi:hypothetical protein